MRWQMPLALALAMLVAVSCDQQPVEPQTDQVAEAPAFNFMSGPKNPGNSGIDRWNGRRFSNNTTDPERGLLAAHYQADNIGFCGGSEDKPAWDMQRVQKGNGGATLNAQLRDAPVFIYDLGNHVTACTSSPPSESCCIFLADEYLYKGTHDATANDNSWWDTEDQKQNVWQFKFNGIVYDPDGNKYRYREHQKAFYDFDALEEIWTIEDIVVH
jgi:hypothetical protein